MYIVYTLRAHTDLICVHVQEPSIPTSSVTCVGRPVWWASDGNVPSAMTLTFAPYATMRASTTWTMNSFEWKSPPGQGRGVYV